MPEVKSRTLNLANAIITLSVWTEGDDLIPRSAILQICQSTGTQPRQLAIWTSDDELRELEEFLRRW